MIELEWAYLAGFFDGDGCVNITRYSPGGRDRVYHKVQVKLTQNNTAFLTKWAERTGLGSIHARPGATQWSLVSAEAEQFLRAILPYADRKANEIAVALQFRDTVCSISLTDAVIRQREELLEKLKEVKQDNKDKRMKLKR